MMQDIQDEVTALTLRKKARGNFSSKLAITAHDVIQQQSIIATMNPTATQSAPPSPQAKTSMTALLQMPASARQAKDSARPTKLVGPPSPPPGPSPLRTLGHTSRRAAVARPEPNNAAERARMINDASGLQASTRRAGPPSPPSLPHTARRAAVARPEPKNAAERARMLDAISENPFAKARESRKKVTPERGRLVL